MSAARLLLLSLLAAPAAAQPELVTDRPDRTESAVVVPAGSFQLEVGAFHGEESGNGARRAREAPQSLLRIGLTERSELRLGWGGHASIEEGPAGARQARVRGASDAELGLKLGLGESAAGTARFALLASTSVPIGSRGLSSERLDPEIRLAAGHDLGGDLELGWNLGVAWSSEEGGDRARERRASYLYSVVAGVELGERWGAFGELFGEAPTAGGPETVSFSTGLTFLWWPTLQLDAFLSVGLVAAAEDRGFGFGISYRGAR